MQEKVIFLSFDDGPTPECTAWILETLAQYQAKATFFCVGDNVVKHKREFQSLLEAGHSAGNHTHNHLKGIKTPLRTYLENTALCSVYVESKLFRPPYGKMTSAQARRLMEDGYRIIMWSLLTYDFDKQLDREEAWQQILKHTRSGSILVFHDNVKAFENLQVLLPRTLEYFGRLGYRFEGIRL